MALKMNYILSLTVIGIFFITGTLSKPTGQNDHCILNVEQCGGTDHYLREQLQRFQDKFIATRELITELTLQLSKQDWVLCNRSLLKRYDLPVYGYVTDGVDKKSRRLLQNAVILEAFLSTTNIYSKNYGKNIQEKTYLRSKVLPISLAINNHEKNLKDTTETYVRYCCEGHVDVNEDIVKVKRAFTIAVKKQKKKCPSEISILRRQLEDLKIILENFIGDIEFRLYKSRHELF